MTTDTPTTTSLPDTLSIRMAAWVLNVSSAFVVSLLESDQIRYQRTGRLRTMTTEDVLSFKRVREAQRQIVLDELARVDGQLL